MRPLGRSRKFSSKSPILPRLSVRLLSIWLLPRPQAINPFTCTQQCARKACLEYDGSGESFREDSASKFQNHFLFGIEVSAEYAALARLLRRPGYLLI